MVNQNNIVMWAYMYIVLVSQMYVIILISAFFSLHTIPITIQFCALTFLPEFPSTKWPTQNVHVTVKTYYRKLPDQTHQTAACYQ